MWWFWRKYVIILGLDYGYFYMTTLTLLGILALMAYCVNALWIGFRIGAGKLNQRCQLCQQIPALFGFVAHTLLVFSIFKDGHLDLSFFNSLMLIAWLITGMYIFTTMLWPVLSLGVLVYPVSGFCALLYAFLSPHVVHLTEEYPVFLKVHILCSVFAYSVFSLAAVQALVLAVQDSVLHGHKPSVLIMSLPPLQTMERLLFSMVWTGFILLTIALGFGFFEVDNLLTHKVILSVIAWCIFGALLVGRLFFGWRGRIAVRYTLSGVAFLIMAFFGSKLVIELILS